MGNKVENLVDLDVLFCTSKRVFIPTFYIYDSNEENNALSMFLEDYSFCDFSVRSSPSISMPGLGKTYLRVGKGDITDRIQDVLKYYQDPKILQYCRIKGIDPKINSLVIVQRMIEPKYAGVVHSVNPKTGTNFSGEFVENETGDKLMAGKVAGKPISNLPTHLWDLLTDTAQEIEGHFKRPQEIEFAFDREDKLWILQSRNLKLLNNVSSKPITPEGFVELADIKTNSNEGVELKGSEILFQETSEIPENWNSCKAIICRIGSLSCHLSILLSNNNKVYGIGDFKVSSSDTLFINGWEQKIYKKI